MARHIAKNCRQCATLSDRTHLTLLSKNPWGMGHSMCYSWMINTCFLNMHFNKYVQCIFSIFFNKYIHKKFWFGCLFLSDKLSVPWLVWQNVSGISASALTQDAACSLGKNYFLCTWSSLFKVPQKSKKQINCCKYTLNIKLLCLTICTWLLGVDS